jgi:hypothetical protein
MSQAIATMATSLRRTLVLPDKMAASMAIQIIYLVKIYMQ